MYHFTMAYVIAMVWNTGVWRNEKRCVLKRTVDDESNNPK